jgi:membrane protease YdiL (CAAX protease family)
MGYSRTSSFYPSRGVVTMNSVVRIWQRIPVLIRAVLSGLFVQVVGFAVLVVVIPLNLRLLPGVPWALLPLGVALWAYWSYFGGRGWPRGTAEVRRHRRRSNPVPRGLRAPVIVAGSLFSMSVLGIAILQYALKEMPPEALGLAMSLSRLPLWTSIPLALAAAFFVGVGEELSFRGYMQVPIEDRHGPWLGLTVPAVVFALAHGTDLMILPVFFVVSIGWSYLAWSVNSIRPGIVFHTLIDSVGFLWAIFRLEDLQHIMEYSLIDAGLTSGYWLLLSITLVLTAGTLVAFVVLHRTARRQV